MDLAMGAMGSLLPKLGDLLKDEYKMQTSVKRDVESFSRELRSMRTALGRVAEVPRDQLDDELKLWAGDVRELSYDMEDVVDSHLVRIKGSEPGADMGVLKELMDKMVSLFKKGKARREIATAIKDIKEQVRDVATRHKRLKAEGVFANLAAATRTTTVDPLLVALYEDQQRIVGIGNARDEIIEKLRLDDDDVSKQPKILSIVGFGGLGKTTLAKAVYDKLKSGFDCAAFVPVSQNPDLKKVFKELLFEVDKKRYKSLSGAMLNEKQLIDELRESLGTKRYFIVIDDIWDINAWKTIQFAFMGNECGSRIITTTRNVSVSEECCSYNDDMLYKMKPLSDDDSQRLFYNRIFSRENTCPPELEQVSRDILKKCGGVPLAIITLASHLASNRQIKPKSQWYVLLNSIGRGLTKGDTSLEEMKRILSFSFYDLPSHLKTCLLYLSVFPEDYYIDKHRLIRRWIAEGFVHGDNLFELGESYFNDLINRSMIQPMYIDVEGRAKGCLVHDMMLDLICDLSSEENFVTVLDVIKGDAPFERKFRRLSLQKSVAELTSTRLATTSMSQVRSVTVFRPAINQILPLSRFQVLRVLDLEDCDLGGSCHFNLRCVGNLLHLRYLGLSNTQLHKIPMEIGNLLFLQILDLSGVIVEELPASIVRLRNLVGLYLESYTAALPAGLRNLTSLEELTGAKGNLEELGYLTELRVLHIYWPENDDDKDNYPIIVESLGKLRKLQRLMIESNDYTVLPRVHLGLSFDPLRDWVPSPDLRRVHLGDGWFERLPAWISSSSLPLLSYLYIRVRKVELENIQILGALPALRYVQLQILWSNVDTVTATEESARFMLSADAFPCARECYFINVAVVPSMFPAGAMPMVRHLSFSLRVSDILSADFDLSIRNLPSLEQVNIYLRGGKVHRDSEEVNSDKDSEEVNSNSDSEEVRAVKRAVDDHPNRRLKLCVNYDRGFFQIELSPGSSCSWLEVISS